MIFKNFNLLKYMYYYVSIFLQKDALFDFIAPVVA